MLVAAFPLSHRQQKKLPSLRYSLSHLLCIKTLNFNLTSAMTLWFGKLAGKISKHANKQKAMWCEGPQSVFLLVEKLECLKRWGIHFLYVIPRMMMRTVRGNAGEDYCQRCFSPKGVMGNLIAVPQGSRPVKIRPCRTSSKVQLAHSQSGRHGKYTGIHTLSRETQPTSLQASQWT